ncbi:MAG TPA: hypothetical protein VHH55_05865 [Gaiellaceae bacterium]|jgi:hypothetical protein|nr:hypothetical protein [Gaiellaceae bacterium]
MGARTESVAAAPGHQSKSFWTSAGGVLTGAATLVSAFGGIFTAVYLAPGEGSSEPVQTAAVTQTVEKPAQPRREAPAGPSLAAVTAYVDGVDTLLATSGDSRAELNDLIGDVEAGSITHAEAVSRIEDVIDERRALLDAVSQLETPAVFRGSRTLLRDAISLSVDVDRDVRTWIDAVFGGADPTAARAAWIAGSEDTSAAKEAFKAEYNAVRARFGLGSFTADV